MPEKPKALFSLKDVWLAPSRLRGVSVDVPNGVTVVLGRSGAGKTSLLNVLANYEIPGRGTVVAPSKVFWSPQDGGLWPGMTVREHFSAMTRDEEMIRSVSEGFELTEVWKHVPETLSRGQQARLSVARALLSDADALIMDEPLAHIDVTRRSPFWQIIRECVGNRKHQSLVFATHEPELAMGEAEHALCIEAGTILCQKRVQDLYWQPDSEEEAHFLGPVNWFGENALQQWIPTVSAVNQLALRPEQLSISKSINNASDLVVISSRFRGSHEEVTIKHRPSGTIQTVWHRPAYPLLNPDDAVTLTVLEQESYPE